MFACTCVVRASQALRASQDAAQAELESDLSVLRAEVEAFEEIRSELGVLADAFQVRTHTHTHTQRRPRRTHIHTHLLVRAQHTYLYREGRKVMCLNDG